MPFCIPCFFCGDPENENQVVNDYLSPPPLADKTVGLHAIFEVPIILVAGLNHHAVRLQLEALFSNPGLMTSRVQLFYDEKFAESGALANVFDIKSVGLPSSAKYSELLQKAITKAWEILPDANYIIVLEEEVIPASDFLNFLRQCFNILNTDKTLIGVSAWNPNGFPHSSHYVDVTHRAEIFPGLGFILKRSFYEQYMKNKMAECCMARSWEGWMVGKMAGMEMIIPEVSRVSRGRVDGRVPEAIKVMFREERRTVVPGQHNITDPNLNEESKYVAHMTTLISKSKSLNEMGVDICLKNKTYYFNLTQVFSDTTSTSHTVFFDDKDNQVLTRLCQCFKLHGSLFQPAYGRHRGVLRFNQQEKTVLLVSSASSYFRYKPASVKQLTVSQVVS